MRALMLIALGVGGPAQAAPDAQHGERLFAQCQACHALEAGKASPLGPNLNGVVGAKAGSRPDYDYSPALAKSGLTWDAKTLDRWLTKPSAAVPGSRMPYGGMANPQDRADVIAYLSGLPRR